MLILYTFFYSRVFFFLVFDCVVDHAKVSICGKMVYQIGFFLLKNPYIVPMISQIFLDSWLVSHLPIFLWFSCLLESRQCFSVSGFVFLFPISPFFFLISVSGFVFLFPVSGCFSFLFFVSLSVFLFPVSVFLFSFLLSFWVVFLFLVAGIYFSNFWFCFL